MIAVTVLSGVQQPGQSQHTFQSVLPEAAGLFLDLESTGPIAHDGLVDAAKAYHRMQNRIRTQNTRLHESTEKKVKRLEQYKSYYKKKVANETPAQKSKRLDRERDRYHKEPRSLTAAQKKKKKKRNERVVARYHKKQASETAGERKKRLTYHQTAYYKRKSKPQGIIGRRKTTQH